MKKRFSEEQIIGILNEQEAGASTSEFALDSLLGVRHSEKKASITTINKQKP